MILDKLQDYLPILLRGAVTTIWLTIAGIALAGAIAFAAGLANVSRSPTLKAASRTYIEFFRGTSELVQLYWFAFAVPLIFGFRLASLAVAVLVLGLNLGAYGSEVVRGAILSVPKEQYEGALALNFSNAQRMRRVILPQAVVGMIPPFNNLAIQLLKSTSVVSLIGVVEMMGTAGRLRNSTGDTLIIFSSILVLYFIFAYIITMIMRVLERRAARSIGRGPVKRTGLVQEGAA